MLLEDETEYSGNVAQSGVPGVVWGVPVSDDFSVRRRARSFLFAFRGVRRVLLTQPNARIHAAATVLVVVAGALLGVSRLDWALLVLAMGAVWSAEAFNTAVEALGDAVASEPHPLVGPAKDAAAGAVLVAAVCAALVGGLVFVPRLLS
jgi:diacylglycerol kinase (ATP)